MEDREIIELFESRSENAISETANRYGGYLMKIASNILADRRDAEETLSDAYMKAWNTIPPAKPDPLKKYLAVIVRSLALNRYNYNKAKKRNSEFDILLSELEMCVPSDASVEKSLDCAELTRLINSFLTTLKDEERRLFVLRYRNCESIASLSQKFSMKESKVKTVLFRTRQKLRKYLESEEFYI